MHQMESRKERIAESDYEAEASHDADDGPSLDLTHRYSGRFVTEIFHNYFSFNVQVVYLKSTHPQVEVNVLG